MPPTLLPRANAFATPQAVANYFLSKARAEGRGLTPMQLNKLVYIAYGWVLAMKDQCLFDERIEAWQHGPVIPSLYHEFKHNGGSTIDGESVVMDPWTEKVMVPTINESYDPELTAILNRVWGFYKGFSGGQLRNLTHQSDSPWTKVYKAGQRHTTIPDDLIRAHYVGLINKIINRART